MLNNNLAPHQPVNNLVPQLSPQPIVRVTPTPTSIICGSGLTTSTGHIILIVVVIL